MNRNFRTPDFSSAELELRFEDGVVCIYGTQKGLRHLSHLCRELADHPGQGHIHLDRDHFPTDVLTDKSEVGAIAVFGTDTMHNKPPEGTR